MDTALLSTLLNQAVSWITRYLHKFSDVQWLLLIGGLALAVFAIVEAWQARRIASYKLAVWGAKMGCTMIVLAFAWPYACDLYNSAKAATGNPIIAMLSVLAGGFLGYNVVKMLFRRRERV